MVFLSIASAAAQDTTALAKTSQNPVGDIMSGPFEFNFNGGGGLEDQTLSHSQLSTGHPNQADASS